MLDFVKDIQREYYIIHEKLFGKEVASEYIKSSTRRYGEISRMCEENNLKNREEWEQWEAEHMDIVKERLSDTWKS